MAKALIKAALTDSLLEDDLDILLQVLDLGGDTDVDGSEIYRVLNKDYIGSHSFLPLINELRAHSSSDDYKKSIMTFLSRVITIQRNADGTISPEVLKQNPCNKLDTIEQQLFEVLITQLGSADQRVVKTCVDVVTQLIHSIGITPPQHLLTTLTNNTIAHYGNNDTRNLAASELSVIGELLSNPRICYDNHLEFFHTRLKRLATTENSYNMRQVLQRLDTLQLQSSMRALMAMRENMDRNDPPSSSGSDMQSHSL